MRARRLVLAILGFWWGAALHLALPTALGTIVLVAAMVSGFVFFFTVSQVAAHGTGFHALDYWRGVPGRSRAPAADKRRVGSEPLNPRWWARVVDATGWPRPLVWLALAVSLAGALVATALSFRP